MKLYIGADKVITQLKINPRSRFLDLGMGCYFRLNKKDAEHDAQEMSRRMESGSPILNIFEIDNASLNGLKILRVSNTNLKWVRFIVRNRRGSSLENEYGAIISPVPNARLYQHIYLYENKEVPRLRNVIKEMQQLRHIREEDMVFKTQAVFTTEHSLSFIKYLKSVRLMQKKYRKDFPPCMVDFCIPAIIDYVKKRKNIKGMGILRQFYFSKVYEKLCDAYLKVGQFSKYAIGEMFIEELETGHLSYPDEVLI